MRGMAVDFQMFFGIKRTVYKNRGSHYLLHSERQVANFRKPSDDVRKRIRVFT